MTIDINKINSFAVLRISFPSRNKANKFIRTLMYKHGYEIAEPWSEEIKKVGKDGTLLLIYKKSLLPTTLELFMTSTISYNEFILPDIKVKPSELAGVNHIIKGLPFVHGSIHYLTKDVNDSDLALRYYIDFYCRPTYVGKWFVKCKKTKKYLEITPEQAKIVNDTMTNGSFSRVIGFREFKGFKRIIVKDNDLSVTLNDELCMIQPIKIKDVEEQEWS